MKIQHTNTVPTQPLECAVEIDTQVTEPTERALSQAAEAAIADIIGPRLLIPFALLDQCFRIARGVGVSLHTIREWEGEGMPHQHYPGDRFYFYDWPEVWRWYRERGRVRKQKPTNASILSQTWAPRSR